MYWNIFVSETAMEIIGPVDSNALASTGHTICKQATCVFNYEGKREIQLSVHIPRTISWKDVVKIKA